MGRKGWEIFMTPTETKKLLEISRDVKASLPEVRRIVRENAWMRKWVVKLMSLVEMNGPAADVYCEIQHKMPTLFKESK